MINFYWPFLFIEVNIKMKIKQEDYNNLKAAIKKSHLFNPEHKQKYENEGFTDERYRWDCLWTSKYNFNYLYKYLNDSHIDTALKSIVNEELNG
jgi:hypothetical protein